MFSISSLRYEKILTTFFPMNFKEMRQWLRGYCPPAFVTLPLMGV